MGRRSLERLQEDEQLEQLPVSRIRTIMKSSPEVEGIRKEALFLVNKATEFFIQFLASTAYARVNGAQELDYDYLSEIVRGDKRLTFMSDLFPKRITYKEYKELMEKRRQDAEKDKTEDAVQEAFSVETTELPDSKDSKMKVTAEKKSGKHKKLPKQKELCVPKPNKIRRKDGINIKKPNSKSLDHSRGRASCDESDTSENDYNIGGEEKDNINDSYEENIDDTPGDYSEKMQE